MENRFAGESFAYFRRAALFPVWKVLNPVPPAGGSRSGAFERRAATLSSCVQGSLEQIQAVLNSTEVGLHQLTALVDCRSLHMVSHLRRCVTDGGQEEEEEEEE